ncbi:hypothetical protein BABINDRAFT_160649 [Babjeviella inositovora NRRL Y-12698]|uniref:Pescadillo homolog n=1 Tax=Babjeviella inositovora NRRL Y-12698 TaxID=984486 RepID=A0A1E3QUC8_9ASCO|nr:uncharacterized protein BABINDRAFT_160649 [Babjeviella inositovora NRRL Y-12698]ODQ81279.1 hypothetical protein BABINDRAFT_160649 [Babjeviella inositovora NRRL Y-12698]
MKIKKKNTSGNAKNFITRTQAVKKLQVSLADFRRLCIFKGIYPREPRNKKKANKGSTAPVTFYYTKDIQYLLHEPVLAKFREHKTFAKKLQKALGRGEVGDAKRLDTHRPKYTLDHVIKERYPTFLDAVRDIDDALNMLFLFANMPATDRISHRVTKEAEKLCNQWSAYVARERLVRKVFVSIKGVYYLATVKGQDVMWLVPFKFPQNIPSDVDFRIMLTFLEFYSTLLHFVLYRLYTGSNLMYPPKIDQNKLKGIGGLSTYVLESSEQGINGLLPAATASTSTEETKLSSKSLAKALAADQREEDALEAEEEQENVETIELDEFKNQTGDNLAQPSQHGNPTAVLFSEFVFYVGREVPLDILEFLVLACGGRIVSEAALDELLIDDANALNDLDLSAVTHQICDRPTIAKRVPGRTYVQPQWIFDSLNKSTLLNVSQYAPGETLPPHLSPWGDAGIYDPEAPVEAKDEESEEEAEDVEDVEDVEESEDEDEDLVAQKELELEAAGIKYSETPEEAKKASKKRALSEAAKEEKETKEEKDLKMIMMTNKQRKLYKKMQYGIDKKETRAEELTAKKRKLQKAKEDLKKL